MYQFNQVCFALLCTGGVLSNESVGYTKYIQPQNIWAKQSIWYSEQKLFNCPQRSYRWRYKSHRKQWCGRRWNGTSKYLFSISLCCHTLVTRCLSCIRIHTWKQHVKHWLKQTSIFIIWSTDHIFLSGVCYNTRPATTNNVQIEDLLSKCGVAGKFNDLLNYAWKEVHYSIQSLVRKRNTKNFCVCVLSGHPFVCALVWLTNFPPRPTFPQVYVKGVLIGGGDDAVREIQSGELQRRLSTQ